MFKKRRMNVDNAKSQMRKGMLEYCVMLLLRKEPSYASDIIVRLKEAELIVLLDKITDCIRRDLTC